MRGPALCTGFLVLGLLQASAAKLPAEDARLGLPPLKEVPAAADTAAAAQLRQERGSLLQREDALVTRGRKYDATYPEQVPQGSPLFKPAQDELDAMAKELAALKLGVEAYNGKVDSTSGGDNGSGIDIHRPVALLSNDPDAARRCALRLTEVNRRITRLKGALALLSGDNPEWEREWQSLHDEQQRNADALMWKGINDLTLDLAMAGRLAAERHLQLAAELKNHAVWDELQLQEQQLIAREKSVTGADADALRATIRAMDELCKARASLTTADAIAKVRDVLASSQGIHQEMARAAHGSDTAQALLAGSSAMGQVAIIFLKGVEEKSAMGAQLAFDGIEIGLLYKSVNEEESQFADLSRNSYDRHKCALGIQSQLGELESEQRSLEESIRRASTGAPPPQEGSSP